MKQNIMKKWIKSLRSGEFKQGRGTLKQYNNKGKAEHCCLGVLCELYNREMKKNKKKTIAERYCDSLVFRYGNTKFGNQKHSLPKIIEKWSGVKDSVGLFTDCQKETQTLAELNDDGYSFKKIASIIEKNWENL